MNEYLLFWKNYANFHGRSSRKEYWMVWLVELGFLFPLSFLATYLPFLTWLAWPISLYNVVTIVPHWALMFRRLHDIDKSGWYMLWAFVPIVGQIMLFIYSVTAGDTSPNTYGPSPYAIPGSEDPVKYYYDNLNRDRSEEQPYEEPPNSYITYEEDAPYGSFAPPSTPAATEAPTSIDFTSVNYQSKVYGDGGDEDEGSRSGVSLWLILGVILVILGLVAVYAWLFMK